MDSEFQTDLPNLEMRGTSGAAKKDEETQARVCNDLREPWTVGLGIVNSVPTIAGDVVGQIIGKLLKSNAQGTVVAQHANRQCNKIAREKFLIGSRKQYLLKRFDGELHLQER